MRHKPPAHPPIPPIPTSDVPSADAARSAQRASTARFMEVVHEGIEVRRLSSTLAGINDRNGFGRKLKESMRLDG